MQVQGGCITGADVAACPYSVGILCKFTPFLGTLHWPWDAADLGHFGISFCEVLILFEQWAGHRLLSEKVTTPHVRANRPMLIPSVPVSEGIEIRHGCQFVSSLVGPYRNQLEKWAGSCHVVLVFTCPGYVIWCGINVLMVFLQDPWNLVIINA